ncbi:hypothetical protein ABNB59_04950 [Paenibacillus larvae]|uniref:Uncharacterized protein n=2 Tax=Paenibacillus larvae TaxID=1464 RepID=A0A2L1TSC1_9BACL|nr:hypothetical protein [Paenibacillus larvae]AVF23560.1 hypothetical protein ERICI_03821 [Paenibacillus larvae subsp. larvae]AVF25015.1 hypothetical protein ERICIII_00808 [Paenibacillus larvae subsp. larvae]AVF29778.1 hypothetical protein ERICIV_00810 [Paenibacillus larvae subsp. larvae]ETK29773.1 hypothetical protein ERIC1_1c33320 [Paenibacillus larvae subsp. larvae DSM 25719]MCY7476464.1 hypothetical protein [Paenibacillus larvae]
METVFRSVEKEVKSYLHLGDLLATGSVCPFLSKLHIENSYRKLFVFFILEFVENP